MVPMLRTTHALFSLFLELLYLCVCVFLILAVDIKVHEMKVLANLLPLKTVETLHIESTVGIYIFFGIFYFLLSGKFPSCFPFVFENWLLGESKTGNDKSTQDNTNLFFQVSRDTKTLKTTVNIVRFVFLRILYSSSILVEIYW
jgi:hypothetical protein